MKIITIERNNFGCVNSMKIHFISIKMQKIELINNFHLPHECLLIIHSY